MNQDSLDKFIQTFDDYLDGKLNAFDEVDLERALKQNPELKSKLNEHIDARANIRIAGEQQLKSLFLKEFKTDNANEDLTKNDKSDPQSQVTSDGSNRIVKSIIIGLILGALIMSIYFFISKPKDEIEEEPFIIAMVEDPSYELLRGESNVEQAENWRQAVQSFMKKDYKNTLLQLKKINTDSKFIEEHAGKYALMRGVANLKLEQFGNAETELTKITSDNPYFDQAEWYLALVAYFDSNERLAKERLDVIIQNENHFRRDKAIQLLSQIE